MTDNTNDLMQQLKKVDTPQEIDMYLEQIRDKYPKDFAGYINTILEHKGIAVTDMQKKSGIERTYLYQILNGRKNPGRDKIIAIAIACRMDLAECQRALEITEEGILYAKSIRDSLIIYAINKHLSLIELNSLLEDHQMPVLN